MLSSESSPMNRKVEGSFDASARRAVERNEGLAEYLKLSPNFELTECVEESRGRSTGGKENVSSQVSQKIESSSEPTNPRIETREVVGLQTRSSNSPRTDQT